VWRRSPVESATRRREWRRCAETDHISGRLPDGIGVPDDLEFAIAKKIAGPSDKILVRKHAA